MPIFGKAKVLPVVFLATFAASATAQQQCDVDQGTPNDVVRAMLALTAAQGANSTDMAQAQLKTGLKLVSETNSTVNPLGRAFLNAKLLIWWLNLDGTPYSGPRSTYGIAKNPTGQIDLPTEIDSLFTMVEKAMPACADEIQQWRRQKGWVNLLNQAIAQMNADSVDAAVATAKSALKLSRATPYAYLVLANAEQKREKPLAAIEQYKAAAAEAAKDTTFKSQVPQILYQLGTAGLDCVERTKDAAEKQKCLAEAKAAFETLSTTPNAGAAGEFAGQALIRLTLAGGDTAAVKAMVAQQIADPTKFGFMTLVQTGAAMAQANQNPDAIKLFDAAVKMNPYHRDGLFNLARLYVLGNQPTMAMPLLLRLVAVDPNGAENYRLLAYAYQGVRQSVAARAKDYGDRATALTRPADAAKRKALVDSNKVTADSSVWLIDSIMKNSGKADSLPSKVTFTEFTAGKDSTVLGGSIENNSAAAKSYTLKIEFLDAGGAVVTTGEQVVAIPAKGRGEFKIIGKSGKIAAFKYAAIN